jgi:hypothetical protein
MGAVSKRNFANRSERIQSHPEKFSSFVRFSFAYSPSVLRAAQFTDVSSTGMQLIAREAVNVRVGDIVEIEFSLVGSERQLNERAMVVRQLNEFVFAVNYLSDEPSSLEKRKRAIADYIRYIRENSTLSHAFKTWLVRHKQGLFLSCLGIVFFLTLATWIYSSSDEHLGLKLRSWGHLYPKQWDTDYYKGYSSKP